MWGGVVEIDIERGDTCVIEEKNASSIHIQFEKRMTYIGIIVFLYIICVR